ncbi:putative Repressor of RNA polymerase III transcription [Blattamonas nauphoetae]|uniref:Repressor of RNA polymerase III transcription n=1 Tax=Blattamonas nauphoetae TaxID=2049346 RepID=A0ABQ9YFW8_9EUKA|nr:putative Repressor of RNA polymerase III transcription [Blattamonas nauphoetae]
MGSGFPSLKMRFLQYPSLGYAMFMISGLENASSRIHLQLECYSCKNTGDEKKHVRELENEYSDCTLVTQAFGQLSDQRQKKTLITLVNTLHSAFPSYSFGHIQPTQFQRHSDHNVVTAGIDMKMMEIVEEYVPDFREILWKAILSSIEYNSCEIYQYFPELEVGDRTNPFFEEGLIWNQTFFFYHREEKKVLLLSMRCVSKLVTGDETFAGDYGDMYAQLDDDDARREHESSSEDDSDDERRARRRRRALSPTAYLAAVSPFPMPE